MTHVTVLYIIEKTGTLSTEWCVDKSGGKTSHVVSAIATLDLVPSQCNKSVAFEVFLPLSVPFHVIKT